MIGKTLSHYVILEKLGGGGMGVVYKAEDTKLGRQVALKFLPEGFSKDRATLERFQREARAASALNHPNICTIHEIDVVDDGGETVPFIAMELLEGQTLKHRIADKPMPFDQVLDLGIGASSSAMPTIAAEALLTSPGTAVGTVAYMSPEQVHGEELDARSDLFSFGTVLYEMATGRQAFTGDTGGVITEAILNRAPAPPTRVNPDLPGEFEIILAKALEKDRELRCQTAAELRADLKRLKRETESSRSGIGSGFSSGPAKASPAAVSTPKRSWYRTAVALALAAGIGLAGGVFLAKRQAPSSQPVYQQLTFRRGNVYSARFAPDGQTIIYSAAWDGNPSDLYSTRGDSPESRPMGLSGAQIAGISSTGEMAVLLRSRTGVFEEFGTLARLPLAGGAPREILEDANWANWSTDGSNLATAHDEGGFTKLEFPAGRLVYKTPGWIGDVRIAPKGDRIAFVDHPARGDDGGSVAVVDLSGMHTTLSSAWISAQGLAWSPSGEEIWFTATKAGVGRALHAVNFGAGETACARSGDTNPLRRCARQASAAETRDCTHGDQRTHCR